MLLKVGELAKQAGITVRALHHYDAIGLLRPSGRSDSGYRLYNEADVSRLYAIQSLRDADMPLDEIARVLDEAPGGDGVDVIEQHLAVLEQEIRRAEELRAELGHVRDKLVNDRAIEHRETPLEALALMHIYRQHFTMAELKMIQGNWPRVQAEWRPLIQALWRAMSQGLPPDAVEIQPLLSDWIGLTLLWMEGDLDLAERWGQMYEKDHWTVSRLGPPRELNRYVRLGLVAQAERLKRYFTDEEIIQLGLMDRARLCDFDAQAKALIAQGVEPSDPAALELLGRVGSYMEQWGRSHPALLQKLQQVSASDPCVAAMSPLSAATRDFLARAVAAYSATLAAPA
jgi:DNA-binding transcriptional MerR regulator